MREAIIESKWKYDVSPEDKQVFQNQSHYLQIESNPGRLEKSDPRLHGAVLLSHLLRRLRPRARAQQLPEELQVLDGRSQRAQAIR